MVVVSYGSFAAPFALSDSPGSSPRHFIGEYEATEAVVISEDLLAADFHGADVIRGILSANAQVWIVTRLQSDINSLKKRLREGGLSSREFDDLRFIALPHSGPWLRDYGPKFILEGSPFGDSQLTLNLVDAVYRDPTDPAGDLVPQALGKILNTPVISFPFDLDGGNLLTTSQLCLTSRMTGDAPRPSGFASGLRGVGCKDVVDLSDAPHAHVDMWVKFVSSDLALVHEVDERTMAVAKEYFGGSPQDLTDLRLALDQKAKDISRHMRVKRLPLPLPFRNVFRSYANALLVNGTAIVPKFKYFGWTRDLYPDHSLNGYYEHEVENVYKSAGFRVVWVNGDGLIYNGGGFRCASFQIPRLATIISLRKGFQGGRTL